MQLNIKNGFLISIAIFLLSFLGWLWLPLDICFFIILLAVFGYLCIEKPAWALGVIFLELAIGGNGYLFVLPIKNFILSIRIAFFIVLMLVWLFKYVLSCKSQFHKSNFFWPSIIFFGYLLINVGLGLVKGLNPQIVFADMNGFLFFLLIFPIYDVYKIHSVELKKIIKFMTGGILLLSVFLVFSFLSYNVLIKIGYIEVLSIDKIKKNTEEKTGELVQKIFFNPEDATKIKEYNSAMLPVKWAYNRAIAQIGYTGLGDLQRASGNSLIYGLITLAMLGQTKLNISKKKFYAAYFIVLAAIIVSFTRSFWVGALVIFLLLGLNYLLQRKLVSKKKLTIVCISVLCLVLLLVILKPGFVKNSISAINPRGTDFSSMARIAMIKPLWESFTTSPILGGGLGSLVVYDSPALENYGLVSKFVFEWGYLDFIHDLGIIGFIIFIYFISSFIRKNSSKYLIWAVIAVLVIHFFTPYLNVPLGIGFLLLGAMSGLEKKEELSDNGAI